MTSIKRALADLRTRFRNLFKRNEKIDEAKSKWKKLARKDANYYIFTNKRVSSSEATYRKSGEDDVREHLTRMSGCKEFFPECADKRAIGAVAGMIIEENVSRFAIGKGLFVIEQAGDTLHMANDAAFQPRTW